MAQHKAKFKQCKKYRYIPGQVSKPYNDIDLKLYNIHRYRVFMAKPVVDSKPYKLDPMKWIDRKKLQLDLIRAITINRENKELLKRINVINRKGGYVDTYNPIAYRRWNRWFSHEQLMRDIEVKNKELYRNFVQVVAHYDSKRLEAEWQQTLKNLDHSSVFPFKVEKTSKDAILRTEPSISDGEMGHVLRPLCFLEFQVKNGEFLGRIIIELYYDYTPVTVQNFLSLCKGEDGLTYKNCLIHRIIKGQYLETGDITKSNGFGGFSIYGEKFQEENHVLQHSKAGVLSMKRIAPTDNNSQFCITFKRMESLNNKNVVFGKVIKGNDNLFKIQDYGRKIGKPYAEIIISNCGEISREKFKCSQKSVKTERSKRSFWNSMSNAAVGNPKIKCKCLPRC